MGLCHVDNLHRDRDALLSDSSHHTVHARILEELQHRLPWYHCRPSGFQWYNGSDEGEQFIRHEYSQESTYAGPAGEDQAGRHEIATR